MRQDEGVQSMKQMISGTISSLGKVPYSLERTSVFVESIQIHSRIGRRAVSVVLSISLVKRFSEAEMCQFCG
jgi:hypothetical protein